MCIHVTLATGDITDMSIIAFPDPAARLLRRIATADVAELPVLQREACRLLRLPMPDAGTDELTDAERLVLDALGERVQRSPRWIAERAGFSESYVRRVLTRLRRRGLVVRAGHYHRGGWLRVPGAARLADAA